MIPRTLGRALARHRPGPALILVTDRLRLPDPLAAMHRLAPGDGVLLRHYDSPDRARLAMAVARLARRLRLVLLVAGDWRLAARLKAQGLHLPEGLARRGVLAPALGWRRKSGAMLSIACHSPAALGRARRLGADAALLSPAFPTRSHPGAAAIGPVRFGLWARRAGLPVIALGGVDRKTVHRLAPGSAAGVAAIGMLSEQMPAPGGLGP